MHKAKIGGLFISVAGFAYAAVQFLQVVWISRIYGADDLGIYSLIVGMFAPALSILSSGQRFILLTHLHCDQAVVARHIILRSSIIILMLIAFLIYSSVAHLLDFEYLQLIAAIGLYKLIDSRIEISTFESQLEKNRKKFFYYTQVRLLPILIACIISMVFQLRLEGYLWICTIIILLLALGVISKSSSNVCRENIFDIQELFMALKKILPIGGAAGIESLTIILPRYYLIYYGSLSQVASFVLLMQISAVIGLFASSKMQADFPDYANLHDCVCSSIRKKIIHTAIKLGLIILVVGFLLYVTPITIFELIFGDWVKRFSDLLFILPIFILIWYVGGYLANIVAIFIGSRWLLIQAIIMFLMVVSCIYIGSWLVIQPLNMVLIALTLAFSTRLGISLFFILKRLK